MTFKAVGKRTSEFRQLQAVIAKGQITKCSPRCQITPGDTLHKYRLKNLTSLALCSVPKHCILKVLFSFVLFVVVVSSYWNSLNQEVLHFVIFNVVFKCLSKVIQFSCSVVSDSLRSHGLQHTRPPCPSPTLGVHPNPCPSSW